MNENIVAGRDAFISRALSLHISLLARQFQFPAQQRVLPAINYFHKSHSSFAYTGYTLNSSSINSPCLFLPNNLITPFHLNTRLTNPTLQTPRHGLMFTRTHFSKSDYIMKNEDK